MKYLYIAYNIPTELILEPLSHDSETYNFTATWIPSKEDEADIFQLLLFPPPLHGEANRTISMTTTTLSLAINTTYYINITICSSYLMPKSQFIIGMKFTLIMLHNLSANRTFKKNVFELLVCYSVYHKI